MDWCNHDDIPMAHGNFKILPFVVHLFRDIFEKLLISCLSFIRSFRDSGVSGGLAVACCTASERSEI